MKICRTALYFDLWKKIVVHIWTFNSRIRFYSKLHSKSGTVLAVKGVPMGNCIVNIYRNATYIYRNATYIYGKKREHSAFSQICFISQILKKLTQIWSFLNISWRLIESWALDMMTQHKFTVNSMHSLLKVLDTKSNHNTLYLHNYKLNC